MGVRRVRTRKTKPQNLTQQPLFYYHGYMRNKLLVIFSVLIFGISPAFAFAQESNTVSTTSTTETSLAATSVTPTATTKREMLKVRPTIHEAMKDAKTELHDKMEAARTEFKTKVLEIKDAKKQSIVTNIDARINNINKNRTDEMSKRLERLTTILTKISTKEGELAAAGKNTATLKNDITNATAAINLAITAVSDQAAKDYVVTLTTDTALKTNVSSTIKQFMTDIKAVFTKVVAAQAAVLKAHTDLAKLTGVSPTPTTTVTTTPVVTTSVTPKP